MAFPFDNITLQLGLGGSIRPTFISTGAVAVWPLSDVAGSTVSEIIANRTGTSDNVSRGDPGMLPEYGCATGFNGTTSSISVAHASALAPTSTFAAAFVIRLLDATIASNQTIIRKENGGTAGRILVGLKSTGPALTFGLNIGGSYAELDYTIPTVSDWVDNARLIVCRYDGTNKQIIQVTTAGTKTTLATTAASGAVGTGSGSSIYFGSNAASSEFFDGFLQWVGWFVNDTPTDNEITSLGSSLVWTDATSDVEADVEAEWGIRDPNPLARIATTGTLQFSLRNHAGNSGGLLGYYSPDHANVRSGFVFGIPVRLSVVDPATPTSTTRRFVGRLVAMNPTPGQIAKPITECMATDFMDELARPTLPAIGLVSDEPTWDITRRLLQELPTKPHDLSAATDGDESFDYGFDTAADEREKVLTALNRLMQSELGYLYVRGNDNGGDQLTFEARSERPTVVTPDWTFSNSMNDLEVTRDRTAVITRVQVTVHPRTIDDDADTVLFTLDDRPAVHSGAPVTIRASYTGPEGARVGGTDMVTPVAVTDYTANSQENAAGSDETASLSVTVTFGANSAEVTFTNTGVIPIYVTFFQLRGRGVYTYEPVPCEATANEATRALYGDVVLTLDQSFQSSSSKGFDAASYLLNAFAAPRTIARSILLRVGQGSPSARISAALKADCGDLVSITETVTGLSDEHYFVNGVKTRYSAGFVETELFLAPREQAIAWILGVAGYSELGVTTYPGF